jgi:hypothetical protein
MNNQSKARQIHAQAEHAREKEQNFLKSLQLQDQAIIKYQQENDLLGFSELLAARYITIKHLYLETGFKSYLILAKHTALAAVEIAEASGIKEALAQPQYKAASCLDEYLRDYPAAIPLYEKAINNMLNHPPDSATPVKNEKALEMKLHLYPCQYKAGDKSAVPRTEQALRELARLNEAPSYEHDVWLSGGHMRLAAVLIKDDPDKAKLHLQHAKQIIDSNPELKLRKIQWEQLASELNKS